MPVLFYPVPQRGPDGGSSPVARKRIRKSGVVEAPVGLECGVRLACVRGTWAKRYQWSPSHYRD